MKELRQLSLELGSPEVKKIVDDVGAPEELDIESLRPAREVSFQSKCHFLKTNYIVNDDKQLWFVFLKIDQFSVILLFLNESGK